MEQTSPAVTSKRIKRPNYPLRVKAKAQALFANGWTMGKVAAEMDVPLETIKSWAKSGKWGETRGQVSGPVRQAVVKAAENAAEALRDKAATKLAIAFDALGEPIDAMDLRNAGQGYAAVLKTLAETHRTLYGGAETNILVFGVDSMNDRPGSQPIIDVSPVEQSNVPQTDSE